MGSPARALIWKEWREQRGVILAGLALAVTLPFILMAGSLFSARGLDLPGVAEALPGFLVFLMWPLFAAACGASTVAGEIGEGTLGFLLSRPVSRSRVWIVKVGSGLASLALIVAGSVVVSRILDLAVSGEGARALRRILQGGRELAATQGPAVAGALLFFFACSVFFSTLLSRAMTAAAAGLAVSLLALAGIGLIWSRLDLVPRLEPDLLALELLLASVLVLLGGLLVFARGELLAGSPARRAAAAAILMIVAGAGLIGIPLAYAGFRLSPAEAVLRRPAVGPEGDSVLATAATQAGASPEVWLIHADGSGFRRVAGRLTLSPAFSPDGQRIAYLSYRGALGLRSDRASLHVVPAEGDPGRVVAEGLRLDPYARYELPILLFSPDGSRIAVMNGEVAVLVPVDGGDPVRVSLEETDLRAGDLLGWTADSRELLVASAPWRREGETVIAALDARDGSSRLVYRGALWPGALYWQTEPPSGGVGWLPLTAMPDGEEMAPRALTVLDVGSGSLTEVSDSVCPFGLDLSGDGSSLGWISCEEPACGEPPCETAEEGGALSVAHLLDLSSMTDRVLGPFPGRPLQARLSPGGEMVAIRRLGHGAGSVVVGAGHVLQEIEEGWGPLGWWGRNKVILEEMGNDAGRLAVAEVETGELREIHPAPGRLGG